MKKQHRILQLATSVAVGLLALSGCSAGDATSPSDSAGEGGVIGFFTISGQIPILNDLADDVTDYVEAEGYSVQVYDGNFDPSEQAQQISQAVSTGSIVAAWIFPVSLDALGSSLEALQSAEIPTVIHASPSDFGLDGEQSGLVFARSDYSEYGTKIAEEAAACANEQGGHEALFLQTVETSGSVAEMIGAVESTFASDAPDVPIVDTAKAADTATAQTNVSQLLIAHPDADVVIAANDENALGAVGAYQAAGKTATCIVVGGGGPDALAAQEAGDIDVVVAWDQSAAVEDAGADLLRLIDDPTAEGGVFSMPITVIK